MFWYTKLFHDALFNHKIRPQEYQNAYHVSIWFVPHALQWRRNERDGVKSPASRLFTQPFIQGADQRKHQSSVSLAFVRGIHRWSVNSPHKGPVTRKIFSFDDVIVWFFVISAVSHTLEQQISSAKHYVVHRIYDKFVARSRYLRQG